uniref:Uncharacterized protein n=1 Tax=Tetradesmus obliquus TaxID=3088 RepID=A0A383V4K7_TETOB|eukprot:jgi/Sobl393_1/14207/SZX59850.1
MADPALQQLREDALTMLVLWATTQEYSADIESLLKQWAGTFQIPDVDLMQRLTDATSGELQRPPDRRTGLGHSLELQATTPTAAAATAAAGGPFVPSGSKRPAAGDAGGSSKRYKTLPVVDSSETPFANIGPALGRKVLRYWPKDAGRNKGDPWFAAVVTDYEEDTGAHILTYQFGTQKEEKERVALALKQPSELRLTEDFIDLLEWYGDPKKRRKSSAVEKSVYLRKQYQALHGAAPGSGRAKSGKGGGKAHSNSALSSGYSM